MESGTVRLAANKEEFAVTSREDREPLRSNHAGDGTSKAANLVFIVAGLVLLFGFARRELSGGSEVNVSQPPLERQVANWHDYAESGHRFGPISAPIVIVEFADFECPACRQLASGALRTIRGEFPDSVAILFRHMPLPYHRLAYSTARAAECAGTQGRFESFHDVVYEHQDSLGIRTLSDFAQEAGVEDLEEYERCTRESGVVPAIEADIAAAQKLDVRATPTLLINGKMVTGAVDGAVLVQYVRDAIADLNP